MTPGARTMAGAPTRRIARIARISGLLATLAVTAVVFPAVSSADVYSNSACVADDSCAPVITAGPAEGATVAAGVISFSFVRNASSDQTVGFQCRIDADPYAACTPGVSYTVTTPGVHTFTVYATKAHMPTCEVDDPCVALYGSTLEATRTFSIAAPAVQTPLVRCKKIRKRRHGRVVYKRGKPVMIRVCKNVVA